MEVSILKFRLWKKWQRGKAHYLIKQFDMAVEYTREDRQWDMRVNVEDQDYADTILTAVKEEAEKGKFKWVLVSGYEIGTRPEHDDYGKRHLHIGAIYNNNATKSSILKNLKIQEKNGYYMMPRNRSLPYKGWRDHHAKEFSKVDKNEPILFEFGELPKDIQRQKRSAEEAKIGTDECIRNIKQMIQDGKEDEALEKYPRNYLMYGEKLKTCLKQKKPSGTKYHPHIWLWGGPGTGKTSLLAFLYPNYYKKDLNNRFFDLYDDKVHTHVMLEDMDHENVKKLGIQFLKTICDEAGFPIDQKYKACQLTKTSVLVTSNFKIVDVCPNDGPGVEETRMAMSRRFLEMHVHQLQQLLGLRLKSDYERKMLKLRGNDDPKAVWLSWNWYRMMPTGEPVKEPEEYQDMLIKRVFM